MLVGTAQFLLEHDWRAAETHFDYAIQLNPNLAHAHFLYGLFTMTLGRAEAADWMDNAARLDPLNPVVQLARALDAMSRYRMDDALRYLERELELDPGHPPGIQLRANLAWHLDDPQAWEYESRIWSRDADIAPLFEDTVHRQAQRAKLLEIGRILQSRAKSRYVQPMQIARSYCLGGDLDSALDVLEVASRVFDLMQIDFLQADCVWHELRSDPRFKRIQSEIGLPC
jgi:tetratricopeptide (TPR) repeat protein